MAYFGVDLEIRVKELQEAFKNQVRNRGGIGIRSLGTIFRRMDHNGNKKLDIGELEEALATFGLFPKKVDLQGMMKYYDVDGDGNISYEEFLRGMRDPLSARRRDLVDRAFAFMDKDGSGVVSGKDIAHLYDVTQAKEFQDGTKTKEEILDDFLNSFDGMKGNNDGQITKQEFIDYYTDLAVSCPTEDYFCVMMEQAWGLAEDSSSEDFQTTLRHIVAMLRQRLLTLSNGQQEEFKLRQIFTEFDANGNGVVTMDELAAMLAALGISVERRFLVALLSHLDTNKSGGVEFEEFRVFICEDPYK